MNITLREFSFNISPFRQFLIVGICLITFSKGFSQSTRADFESDLEIINTVDDNSKNQIGDVVTFTVTVTNLGPDRTGGEVEIDNELGDGYDFISSTTTNGYNWIRDDKKWFIDFLEVGQSETLTIVAELNQKGEDKWGEIETINFAKVANIENTDDPNDENDEIESGVGHGNADISVTKNISNNDAETDEEVSFIIEVENLGPDFVQYLTIEDKLPTGKDDYEYLRHETTKGTYSIETDEWELTDIAVGDVETLRIFVRIKDDSHAGHNHLLNKAEVKDMGIADDPNNSNNESEAGNGFGDRQADLKVTKTIDNNTANVGDEITFTIVAENLGPQDANSSSVIDLLPSGYTYNGSNADKGTYDPDQGVWSIGKIKDGELFTLEIFAIVTGINNYVNTARITSNNSTTDPDLSNNEDSDGINEIQQSDLAVTKTVDNPNANIGDNVNFTVTLTNNGPSDATGVEVTERLFRGYTFVSFTASQGDYDGVNGVWTVGNVPNGETETLLVEATINPDGAYQNIVAVQRLDQQDPDLSNNVAQLELNPPRADLEIVKIVDRPSANVGENVTFTVDLTNKGPNQATNITVQDIIPTGFSYISHTQDKGTYDAAEFWTIDALENAGTARLTLTLEVLPQGSYLNTAEITGADEYDPVPENNISSALITLPSADIGLSKTVNESFPNVGDTIAFSVIAINNGPDDASGLIVKDIIPPGYNYLSSTSSRGTYDNTTGLWDIGDLNDNGQTTLDLFVSVNSVGDTMNIANVEFLDQEDPEAANDTAREAIIPRIVDLAVNKIVSNSTPSVGSDIFFAIEVSNLNTDNQRANNITLLDLLPDGYQFQTVSTSQGNYDPETGNWIINDIVAGATARMTIGAKVLSSGEYENVAEIVSADEFDPDESNNRSSVTVTIPTLDISVNKTVNNNTPNIGENVIFTVQVTNNGPADATSLLVNDVVKDGFELIQANPDVGSYDQVSGNWTIGNLPTLSTATLSITVQLTASGDYSNTVELVSLDQVDIDPTNDTKTITVSPLFSDLALTKTVDKTNPVAGETVKFTVTIENLGPSTTPNSNVIVNDDLPSGFTFSNSTPSQGTFDPISGFWLVGDLANGANASLEIQAVVQASGDFTNVTSIAAADIYDPNQGNNTAVASTEPQFADLKVDKTSNIQNPNVGDTIIFTVVTSNLGPNPATNVAVTDQIPSGYTFIEANANAGSYDNTTGIWSLGTLAPPQTVSRNSQATLDLTVLVTETKNYTNTATVTSLDQTDPDNSNDSDSATPNVQFADLSIQLLADKQEVLPDQEIIFEVILQNLGPDNASNIEVSALLPAGFIHLQSFTTSGTYDPSTGKWTLSQLFNGSSSVMSIRASTEALGSHQYQVQISDADQFDEDTSNNSAVLTPTLLTSDIDVSMTVDDATADVGAEVNFVINVQNIGPNNATNLVVLDFLPPGFEFISSVSTEGTYNSVTGIWNIGILDATETAILDIKALVQPPSAGENINPVEYTNRARVLNVDQYDPIESNNEAEVEVSPNLADLSISKLVDNTDPNVGDQVTFTVDVTNNGPDLSRNVEVTDLLPDGYILISSNVTSGDYNTSAGIWTVGDMTLAEVQTLTLVAEVRADGDFTNVATITNNDTYDPNLGDNTDVASIVAQTAELALTLDINDDRPNIGDEITFTITVTNNGPDAATAVEVTNELVRLGFVLTTSATDYGNYIEDAGVWELGNLPFGEVATLTLNAVVLSEGPYNNEASITKSDQFDPIESNNSASIVVTPLRADLGISMTIDETSVVPGQEINIALGIRNFGPDATTNIVVTDQLPQGIEYIQHLATDGTYDPSNGDWVLNELPTNSSQALIIKARVLPNSFYENTATITESDVFDDNSDNNSVTQTLTIQTTDISVLKRSDVNTANVNDPVTFTVTVRNEGPLEATGLTIEDRVPDGFSITGFNTTKGSYSTSTGIWNIGDLTVGLDAVLTIITEIVPSANHTNTAKLNTLDQTDSDITNNESSINIEVPNVDLAIEKLVDKSNPPPGETVQFTVLLSNQQSFPDGRAGTNITVLDQLPNGYTYVSHTEDEGTYDPTTGIWSIPSLAADDIALLQINATVNSTGQFTNVAEITGATEYDPELGNNIASVSITSQSADLSITKSADDLTPNIGDTITFQVDLKNIGPDPSSNIEVTDRLPSGFSFVSSQTEYGIYDQLSGVWNVGSLGVDETATLNLKASVDATGDFTNIATVTNSDLFDPVDDNDADTVTIEQRITDLALTTASPNINPILQETVSFTTTLSNNGPADATGTRVNQFLPPGLSYQNHAVSSGVFDETSGVWQVSSLSNGASATLTIDAIVNASGSYTNIANIELSDQRDPDLSNNASILTFDVQETDLQIVKEVSESFVFVGDSIYFTVTLNNLGSQTGTNISVFDRIPSGHTILAITPSAGTSYDEDTFIWSVPSLAPTASATIRFDVVVLGDGDYDNTATIIKSDQLDPNQDNNTDDASVLSFKSDIGISAVADNIRPALNEEVTITLSATNNGPDVADEVEVTYNIPDGLEFVSTNTSVGSSDQRVWTIGTIANGVTETLTVKVKVIQAGSYLFTSEVTNVKQYDPNQFNDFALVPIYPLTSDIAVTKTVDVINPNVDDNVTFTITVDNNGPDSNTNLIISDILSTDLAFVSKNPSVGTYDEATGDWSIPNLGSGVSATLEIVATVKGTSSIINTASVKSTDQFDPEPDNNSSEVTLTPNTADLAVTKLVDIESPNPGQTIIFLVTVENQGPSVSTGVELTDLLPDGYAYLSSYVTQGVYNNSTGLWEIGSIAPSSRENLIISARVNATGNFSNTAEITASDVFDPDLSNNEATKSVNVQATDVGITKVVDNPTPLPMATVNFTITATNNGPLLATGVQIEDVLPSGYTLVTAIPSSGNYSPSSGIWTLAQIAQGTPETLTITAQLTANNNYLNTAELISLDQVDTDTSNDSDDATVTVQTADIAVTKIVDRPNANVGENVIFTVTTANNGPDNATNITIEDLLPSGYVLVNATPATGTTYNGVTGEWTIPAFNFGDAPLQLVLTATVNETGEKVNLAELIEADQLDPDATNDLDSAEVVSPSVDMSITKMVDDLSAPVGTDILFTVTLSNEISNTQSATNIDVKETIPSGYTLVGTVSVSKGTFDAANSVWTVGEMMVGESQTLTYSATLEQDGEKTSVSEIVKADQFDPNQSNNIATISVEPQETDLEIRIITTNDRPNVGDAVQFTYTIANPIGPDPGTNIAATALLPDGYTLVSSETINGTYNETTGVWTAGSLGVGQEAQLFINAIVLSTGTYELVAQIDNLDQTDPNQGNNMARLTITPLSADLSVSINSQAEAIIGELVTFNITLTNNGPDPANTITVDAIVPFGYEFDSFDAPTGSSYNDQTGVWSVNSLVSGGSTTLTVRAKVLSNIDLLYETEILSAEEFDPDIDNNRSTFTVIVRTADLQINKTVDNRTPNIGDEIQFTIVITNFGPDTATDVELFDQLPAGYEFVSSTPEGAFVTNTWSISSIAPNESETVLINANVLPVDDYLNTAQITGLNEYDDDLANNTSQASVSPQSSDLRLEVTSRDAFPNVGEQIKVSFTLGNDGPDDAQNIVVSDFFESGFEFISATTSSGTYDLATNTWSVPSIQEGSIELIDFIVEVKPSGVYKVFGQIESADQFDPVEENNADELTFTIQQADLAVSIIADNENPNVGEALNVQIILENLGPNNASVISVSNQIPSGLVLTNSTPSDGTRYNVLTGLWEIDDLATNGTATLDLTVRVLEIGQHVLTTDILGADQQDPNISNNNDEVDLTPKKVDIALSLTVDESTPKVNQDVVFTLLVSNAEDLEEATGIIIDNTIPSGLSFVSASTQPGDSFDPETGILEIRDLRPGANSVFSLRLNVLSEGDYELKSELLSVNEIDLNETNNADSLTLVPQVSDLAISMGVDNSSPGVTEVIEFTISVTNNGPDPATRVSALDRLPSGLSFVDASATGGIFDQVSGVWVIGDLAVSQSETLTLRARVEEIGDYTNRATVFGLDQQDPNASNNSVEIEIEPAFADLSLTKEISNSTPNVGDPVEFTLNISNIDPAGVDATGIVVQDNLPSGYEFVSSDGDYDESTGDWTVGSLTIGETKTLKITATVLEDGTYQNIAVINDADQFDPVKGNNIAIVQVDAQSADLSIVKTVDNSQPDVGATINFKVELDNLGPDFATGIQVEDILSNSFEFVSAQTDYGSYNEGTGIWSIETLENNAKATLSITVIVNDEGSFINTAKIIKSDQSDPNPSNNESTLTIFPQIADLKISKSATTTQPTIGQEIVFFLLAENLGPINTTNVIVEDQIPDGFEFVNVYTSRGTYSPETGLWEIGQLDNGASVSMAITVTTNPLGNHVNYASISTLDQYDPDLTNNNDQVAISIQNADLEIVKKVDNPIANIGEKANFTVTMRNLGPDQATNIKALDKLPTGYTLIEAKTSKGVYVSETGLWSVSSLSVGEKATLELSVLVNENDDYVNTARVISLSQFDKNLSNNVSQALVSPRLIDIGVFKSVVEETETTVGDTVTFEILASNLNKDLSQGTGIEVFDLLPSGYEYLSYSASRGTYDPSSGRWIVGSLFSGEEVILRIKAVVLETGNYLNVTFISAQDQFDPVLSNNSSSAQVDAQVADLELSKTVNVDEQQIGESVFFTVTAGNNGPDPATNIIINDVLPNGYELIGSNTDYGSYDGATWSLGNLDVNSIATLVIEAKVIANGQYLNVATIYDADQYDPDQLNNTASARISTIEADLEMSMSANNTRPIIDENILFTIEIRNNGPSEAIGTEAINRIPSGFTFDSFSTTRGSYNPNTGIWVVDTIPTNGSATLNLNMRLNAVGNHINSAFISKIGQWDPDLKNNNASLRIYPQVADIAVTKVVDNATANVGENVVFTVTVANNGPQDASSLTISDQLPSGYTFVSATAGSGTYTNATGIWDIGALTNGASTTLDITATVLSSGDYTNTATVNTSDQVDNNTANNSDNASVTPPSVDLELTKNIDNIMPNVGDNVVFTIAVENLASNSDNASGVVVSDFIPSGYTYLSDNGAGDYDNTTGTWTVGAVAVGTTESLQITATVNGAGNYTNIAAITAADQYDPVPGNNVDFATTESLSADLAISKVVDNASPNLNDNVVFTVTLSNNGPDVASGVQVTDLLPSGYTYVSDDANGNYVPATGIWSVGTINNGDSYQLNITATVSNISGAFENTAAITAADQNDPDASNNSASATVTVQQADLQVSKTVNNASPIINEDVIFSVTVNNNGPSNASGVQLTDQLPNGYQFSSATATTGTYDQNSGLWDIGNITNGGNAVLTIVAKVISSGAYENTASISDADQYDPDTSNNSDNASVTLQVADIAVTKVGDNATANVGENVVFTVTVANNGPQDASSLTISDQLPSAYTFVSATAGSGTYSDATGIWDIGTLANGASTTLDITATVLSSGDYTNTATVNTSDQVDNDQTNNSAEATVTPAFIDLALNKTIDVANPNIGEGVTFTISVSHIGPSTSNATGIEILDRLPSGFTLINFNPSQGSFDRATNLWTVGELPLNATATLELFGVVEATGSRVNAAIITANDQFDPNLGNNIALQSFDAQSTDLAVSKTADLLTPNVGENVDFTIEVSNNGPDQASNIVIQDLLPSGFTYISASSTYGTYESSTGIWSIDQLLTDSTATLNITSQVLATGDHTNIAQLISLDQVDTDPSNDRDSVIIVPQIADLAVVKTVNESTPNVGDEVIFQINLSNEGTSDASGVLVEDQLPSGLTYVSHNVTNGTFDPITGIWEVLSLNDGANEILSITTKVEAEGVTTNQVSIIASDQFDPNTDNNSSSSEVTPLFADLAITKTVDKENANVAEEVTFEITLNNLGPNDATSVVVSDVIPSGYTLTSSSPSIGNYEPSNGLWSIDALNVGQTETLTLIAEVNSTGDYINKANITSSDQFDNNLANNADEAFVDPPMIDLSISKSLVTTETNVGDTVTFRILLSHNGPDAIDATGVTVLDLLPAGYTFVRDRADIGSFDPSTGIWSIGTLAFTSSVALEIDAEVLATGNYTNIALINSADQFDPNRGDNISFASIRPLSTDLVMSKVVDNENVFVGDTVTFTLSVTNDGPDPASNIQVTDQLPSGYSFIDFNTDFGFVSNGIWYIGNLNKDNIATLDLRAEVLQTGDLLNIAQILHLDETDPNTSNNIDSAEVVIQRADLAIQKIIDDATPVIGQTVVFTITLTNDGPVVATNVQILDQIPDGYNLATFTTSTGNYDENTGIWSVDELANSSSATLVVSATVNESGDHINVASVIAADQEDPDDSNNTASIDINLQEAELSIIKTVDDNSPQVGDALNFTIKVFNNGPDNATNIEVEDILSQAFAFNSSTAEDGSYAPDAGIWSIPSLANGDSTQLVINVILLPEEETSNTASIIRSDQVDNTKDNNTSTVNVNYAISDLEVIKQSNKEFVNRGDTAKFNITVENFGPDRAEEIVIEDLLPNGYSIFDLNYDLGTYDPTTGQWEIPQMNIGQIATLEISTTINETGDLTNTAEITASNSYDPDSNNNSSSVTLNRIITDLSILKEASDQQPNIGDTISFNITVTNEGSFAATNIFVIDPIDEGFEVLEATVGSGQIFPEQSGWLIDNLAPGAIANGEIIVKVLPFGSHSNTAEIIYLDQIDDDPNNDSSTITLNPEKLDLALTKVVDDAEVVVGQGITFTIEVRNDGPADATNLIIEDKIPDGYTYQNHATSKGIYDPLTGDWSIDSLDNDSTATLDITVSVNKSGRYLNVAFISDVDQFDLNIFNNIASATISIENADIGITKSIDNNRPLIGDTVLFTITATNFGEDIATNLSINETLPAGYELIDASGDGTYDLSTGLWSVNSLEVNSTATLFLVCKILPQRGYLNLAFLEDLDQSDPNESNDFAFAGILPQISDLAVNKTVTNQRPQIGDEIDFTVTLTNNGIDLASNIEVLDTLAPGFNYISSSASKGTYDIGTGLWNIASLGVTEVVTLTIKVEVVTAAEDIDTDYTNYASIQRADQLDPNSTNNVASSFVVVERSDLAVSKSIDNDKPLSGDQVTFTVDIVNNGPYTAYDVFVLDRLPSGYNFVSSSSTIGSYDEPAGAWVIGSLVPDEVHSLTLVADALDQGEYLNIAEGFTSSLDPDLTNNIDSVGLAPNNPPIAVDDDFSMLQNSVLNASVSLNDRDEDNNILTYTVFSEGSAGENGVIEMQADGIFRYTPNPTFNGEVSFVYQVCDNGIPVECSQATVSISVTENLDVEIPNGFSPNNDGTDDTWFIEGIEIYPNNNVKIFNRWGNVVWEANGYDNDRVAWNGDAITGIFINNSGEPLPDGTYFYVIDLMNGAKPMSGFVVLKRNDR